MKEVLVSCNIRALGGRRGFNTFYADKTRLKRSIIKVLKCQLLVLAVAPYECERAVAE
jgi:hypothetical protein